MNLLLGSLKGSPGVTTLAVLLSHYWSDKRILIEADSSGGILAGRYDLSPDSPGLLNLVTGCRRNMNAEVVSQSCQQLPGGTRVVVSTGKNSTIQSLIEEISLSDINQKIPDTDLLFDLGRIYSSSCPSSLLSASDVLLLLVRPQFEQLEHLLSQLLEFTREISVGIVLAGTQPPFNTEYSEQEVASAISSVSNQKAWLAGSIPFDLKAANICFYKGPGHKALKKSFLVRSVVTLMQGLKGKHPKNEDVKNKISEKVGDLRKKELISAAD